MIPAEIIKGLVLYYAAVNGLLLIMMGIDKRKAVKGKYRISEAALLFTGLTGGGAGGLLGMSLFRHKTRKFRFYAVFLISVCLHIAIIYYLPQLL
jgi:uncharacterized membrane protein YsdA (DUF1294 family)